MADDRGSSISIWMNPVGDHELAIFFRVAAGGAPYAAIPFRLVTGRSVAIFRVVVLPASQTEAAEFDIRHFVPLVPLMLSQRDPESSPAWLCR